MTQHTEAVDTAARIEDGENTEHDAHTDHHAPRGLLTRGTVVVVPGRGESRATYARFGRRLAADAYRVRVVDPPRTDAEAPAGSSDAFGARLARAVEDTAADGGVARPLILVGPTPARRPWRRCSAGSRRPCGRTGSSSRGCRGPPPAPRTPGTPNSTCAPRAPPTGAC